MTMKVFTLLQAAYQGNDRILFDIEADACRFGRWTHVVRLPK